MTDPHSLHPVAMNSQAEQTASEIDRLTFHSEPCKPLLRPKGEAPFKDSWEAEAYALGNLLVKLNHVTPKEWMELMAESIQEAQSFGDADTGETYYQHWCRSLEKFCFQTGLSQPSAHREMLGLWKRAISNTPHGVPLSIENAFLGSTHPEASHQHHEHSQDEHGLSEHSQDEHSHSEHSHSEDHPHSQSATSECQPHAHTHERPPIPPATYYEPIAKQILKTPSV